MRPQGKVTHKRYRTLNPLPTGLQATPATVSLYPFPPQQHTGTHAVARLPHAPCVKNARQLNPSYHPNDRHQRRAGSPLTAVNR